jgi:hypothetical protein
MRIGLLLALAGVATMPHITMEQTAKGYTAKVATFDLRQQAEVDAEIERRAASLCGDREIRWGEFSSLAKLGKNPSSEPAPVTDYSKAFSCVAPDPRIYDPAPADWKPTSADTHDAIALFETYYSKRDGGDFLGAMRLFAPGVLGDAANWAAEMTVTNNKIGKGKRRITGVTWYVNPDGAPHPASMLPSTSLAIFRRPMSTAAMSRSIDVNPVHTKSRVRSKTCSLTGMARLTKLGSAKCARTCVGVSNSILRLQGLALLRCSSAFTWWI